jgi:DNA modification methylase
VVTKPGDLWQLGTHRLLCGSALEQASYTALLGDEQAQMVFSDPPYNVKIDGHVSGLGSVKHAEFLMASGEMAEKEFAAFCRSPSSILKLPANCWMAAAKSTVASYNCCAAVSRPIGSSSGQCSKPNRPEGRRRSMRGRS